MIIFPAALKASGPAHSGIAPAHLLDVLDVNGNAHFWSDRPVNAPAALLPITASTPVPVAPPVFPIPAGQAMTWALPSQVASGGSAYGAKMTTRGGTLTMTFSAPLAGVEAWSKWDAFKVPDDLPSDAVITGIYPTIICNGLDAPNSAIIGGPDTSVLVPSNPNLSGPGVSVTGLNVDGETSLPSIGTNLSAIQNGAVIARIYLSLGPMPQDQVLRVSFIGLAIYYEIPGGGGRGVGGGSAGLDINASPYLPWILSVPRLVFNRSLATDFGSFVIQNLSGDTLARDFEKIARRSALEGAFFVYRLWQPDVRLSWIEVHGTLTVEGIPADTVTLKGTQLINPAQVDAPAKQYCETCQQVIWGGPGCGATGAIECQYSYQTCQVPERFLGSLNSYEKNYGEALANTALKVINRQRRI